MRIRLCFFPVMIRRLVGNNCFPTCRHRSVPISGNWYRDTGTTSGASDFASRAPILGIGLDTHIPVCTTVAEQSIAIDTDMRVISQAVSIGAQARSSHSCSEQCCHYVWFGVK